MLPTYTSARPTKYAVDNDKDCFGKAMAEALQLFLTLELEGSDVHNSIKEDLDAHTALISSFNLKNKVDEIVALGDARVTKALLRTMMMRLMITRRRLPRENSFVEARRVAISKGRRPARRTKTTSWLPPNLFPTTASFVTTMISLQF
jgi:hypothetical protein